MQDIVTREIARLAASAAAVSAETLGCGGYPRLTSFALHKSPGGSGFLLR